MLVKLKYSKFYENKYCVVFYFVYGDMCMKIKVECLNDKLPLEKKINDLLVYTESIYYDGKYSYYPRIFSEICTDKVSKDK